MELEEISKKISEATAMELELVWLPRIMGNQTDDEKSKLDSIYKNGVGLNGVDACYVTSVWNKVKSGKHLTDTQVMLLRKLLPKYRKQFRIMMNNRVKE